MDTAKERQDLEITALKSIYEGDFFDTPPPKAWKVCHHAFEATTWSAKGRGRSLPLFFSLKGAIRLPEFTIRVVHPAHEKVNFHLNVK